MCFVNSSDSLSGSNNHGIDDYDQQLLEMFLQDYGWMASQGVIGVIEFSISNENSHHPEDHADDEDSDDDFKAYEWMARTDLEQFDKETEQQYWHEVIAEAEESQRTWDQAYASCSEHDLPVLLPDYVEATAFNANLIRLAQEESEGSPHHYCPTLSASPFINSEYRRRS